MKKHIEHLIVVEGKSDVSYLSTYIDGYFITTNGLDVNEEKVNFLKEVIKVRPIIILSDDDEPGERIRNLIKTKINGVIDVKIAKNHRKNYKKQGIAESGISEVYEGLSKYFVDHEIVRNNYDLLTSISLSENPEVAKQKLIEKYRLIKGNIKSLENQLNILRVKPEELWK